jgi:uncharacterized RDD family membrane protein YckC
MPLTSTSINAFNYKTNLKKKIIATLFDYALVLIPTGIYIAYFGHDNDQGGKTVDGVMALPIPALWFICFVVVEAFYGATLAHQALYLKVVTLDRKEIGFSEALK